mmetsp:Transcript_65142/g.201695  ORF Transcript_65142/g.201695 Transcript_65142/m.201695 type:complete len:371 (-) Transcript_65142:140-1252(-)
MPELHEGRLLLQSLEGLLEASNLRLAPLLPLLVGRGLCHTAALQPPVVLRDGCELGIKAVFVRGKLRDRLLQRLDLLALVRDVLVLGRRGDLVLLRRPLVLQLEVSLLRLLLCEAVRHVRLHDLQQPDDAAACAGGLLVRGGHVGVLAHQVPDAGAVQQRLRGRLVRVVLAEDAQHLPHAREARLKRGLGVDVVSVALLADAVQLRLRLRQHRKFALQVLDLLFEARRLRHGLLNHDCELRGIIRQLPLLSLCLGHLTVAEGFLGGLAAGLRLQLRNHALDEALDLREGVSAGLRTVAQRRSHARGELCQRGRVLVPREAADELDGLRARLRSPCSACAQLQERRGVLGDVTKSLDRFSECGQFLLPRLE